MVLPQARPCVYPGQRAPCPILLQTFNSRFWAIRCRPCCNYRRNFHPTKGELLSSVRLNGGDLAFITKVVLTHAHPDHPWEICNSADKLNYPNATYYVGGREWNFWINTDAATSLPGDFSGIVPRTQRVSCPRDKAREVG